MPLFARVGVTARHGAHARSDHREHRRRSPARRPRPPADLGGRAGELIAGTSRPGRTRGQLGRVQVGAAVPAVTDVHQHLAAARHRALRPHRRRRRSAPITMASQLAGRVGTVVVAPKGSPLASGEHPGHVTEKTRASPSPPAVPESAVAGRPLPPPSRLPVNAFAARAGTASSVTRTASPSTTTSRPRSQLGAAGGQHDVRVGQQVEVLLLARAGREPDGPLGPRGDQRRTWGGRQPARWRSRTARRSPAPGGSRPSSRRSRPGRCSVVELGDRRGQRCRHQHLSHSRRPRRAPGE